MGAVHRIFVQPDLVEAEFRSMLFFGPLQFLEQDRQRVNSADGNGAEAVLIPNFERCHPVMARNATIAIRILLLDQPPEVRRNRNGLTECGHDNT
jgi:hypothetical protein